MSRSALTCAVSTLLAVGLAAAAWVFLAPPQLGGATRYAIVTGSSMEPTLTSGDLAVIRSRGDPALEDVVLYHDVELGVDVLHRIVRRAGGRFVLRGDANDFLDDARPAPKDIEGSLWFSVPRTGSALLWARAPLHAALLVFVLTLFALMGGGSARAVRGSEARS